MVRYSLLRLLIFFFCLMVFWALGLRSETEMPYLVIAAALSSMVISYFLLRPMREKFSEQVAHKIDERSAQRAAKRERERAARGGDDRGIDERAEDAETGDSFR